MFWPLKRNPPVADAGKTPAGSAAGVVAPQGVETRPAAAPQGEEIACTKCRESIAIVAVRYPTIVTTHCPLCGHSFAFRATPEGQTQETPESANPPAEGWRPVEPQDPEGKE